MKNVRDFNNRLLQEDELRKMLDFAARQGGKEFADKLNKAREADAVEFLEQARRSIDGLSDKDAARTMTVLAANKLFDVGYREFALLFKQVLQRSEQ